MIRSFHYLLLILILISTACQKEEPVPDSSPEKEETPPSEREILPNDFLSGADFDKLVVEIQYVQGFQPTNQSLENLKSFLQERLNKAAGINLVQTEISSPGKATYSLEDIRNIESANRSQHTSEKTLTAYFFFADGDYAGNNGDAKVLGIAYGSTSMVIFEKTVNDYSGGLSQPSATTLETSVIKHEFAHTLGLVNNGTSMQNQHQDEAHGRHCTNKDCLMYYAVETSDFIGNLIGGNIPELDADCLADLKANGGK